MVICPVLLGRVFRVQRVATALREGPWSSFLRCLSTASPRAALDADDVRRLVAEARIPRKGKHVGTPRTSRALGDGCGRWRCCDCGIQKGAEDFCIRKDGRVPSYCKSCQGKRYANYARTLRGNASVLVSNARHRSKLKDWHFKLDADFVLDLILKQQGRCAYSGVHMEMLLPHSDWRMSLERLNNSMGYVPENCALIAAEFNTPGKISIRAANDSGSSKWSFAKVQRLPAEQTSVLDLHSLHQAIEAARGRSRVLSQPDVMTVLDSELEEAPGHLRCSRCRLSKPVQYFSLSQTSSTGFQRYCKQCFGICDLERRLTLRGHIQTLLRQSRARHRLGKWTGDFELDLNSVLDMLWSQQGRCFYSGVPLRFGQYNVDWMMSLERLDNRKTYTKDNTALIALEFNTSDHSMNKSVGPVLGSSQWSRMKVEHVWGRTVQAASDKFSPLHSLCLNYSKDL